MGVGHLRHRISGNWVGRILCGGRALEYQDGRACVLAPLWFFSVGGSMSILQVRILGLLFAGSAIYFGHGTVIAIAGYLLLFVMAFQIVALAVLNRLLPEEKDFLVDPETDDGRNERR